MCDVWSSFIQFRPEWNDSERQPCDTYEKPPPTAMGDEPEKLAIFWIFDTIFSLTLLRTKQTIKIDNGYENPFVVVDPLIKFARIYVSD